MSSCSSSVFVRVLVLSCLAVNISAATILPNIVVMLTDDLGWNSAWNNPETLTPTLDLMSVQGLVLDSFYTYKYCSPTRGSFLTGRFPYKLCATRNNLNPPSIPEGINLGYTMIPLKLAQSGYVSYHIGKWHQGIFAPEYTPVGRGFNHSFGFLSGGEDHYNQQNFWNCQLNDEVQQNENENENENENHVHIEINYVGDHPNANADADTDTDADAAATFPVVDLYNDTGPALGRNGSYNGYMFTDEAVRIIDAHSTSYSDAHPFFLYFALHNTHGPIEAPSSFVSEYDFAQTKRNVFDAMVSVVDASVANVTAALKRNGYWNNTLFIWCTDNGTPVTVGGSNHPLRGSKGNNFEGGMHVPAVVFATGLLPQPMRGRHVDGLVHIADFYATFCFLGGGLDPRDANPRAPAKIDSVNMWPYWTGAVAQSPRTVIVHDHLMYGTPTQGAVRSADYKLIVMNESEAGWYGQFSPNESWTSNMSHIYACSVDHPCLFDIRNDPTEHTDLADTLPAVTQQMLALFHSYDDEYHPPKKAPPNDPNGYCGAVQAHHGFSAPWVFNVTQK